ncbi:hypothetical protein MPTK1_3g24670 [Marchantia polymorpha subsp. ruderalis]|uniref:Uncharacterized protein n=2 Tax=Marchantia polymorpha TaxID=3197 RepID=A0AAF6B4F2_MARPO|nr:hypothetical protein MARPO_0224s0011 [Marchantia polymorpha]BBN06886.1 hypothetical protein Mp_3g24670 [Marchantia polymorpha subsp. ruderalis]|eukprot:PTQ27097.1 hypothetical protein MARPO_0224s0011 [Marchantia polymorpha]
MGRLPSGLQILERNDCELCRSQGNVATVKTFEAHDAKVIIADIQDAAGDLLARELGGPDTARFIHCNVSHEERVAAVVDLSVSAYGGLHAITGVKHAARVMKPMQTGCIITTASMAAHVAVSPTAYTTFKHALLGLSRSAALELRDFNIRAKRVCPGMIRTSIWNELAQTTSVSQDMAGPFCIANAALFLASDDSSFVNSGDLASMISMINGFLNLF